MKKFRKLVSIDKVALTENGIRELQNYAESIELAQDTPENDEEIVARIGDADAVLLSASASAVIPPEVPRPTKPTFRPVISIGADFHIRPS